MKPGKIILFLVVFLIVSGTVIYFFPLKEIKITSAFSLKFPTKEEFLISETKSPDFSKPIDSLITDSSIFRPDTIKKDSTTLIHIPDSLIKEVADTSKSRRISKPVTTKKQVDFKLHKLEYPNNDTTLLYGFFNTVRNCSSNKELIRVLHYGDSQIEGDRVTTYIRYHLQKKFGGMGSGLFPVKLINKNYISLHLEVSNNWDRYTYYSYRKGRLPHNKIGAMLAISRFTPPTKKISKHHPYQESSIFISKSHLTYSLNRNFKQCRIFYGYNKAPLISEVSNNEKIIDAEMLAPSTSVQVLKYDLHKFPDGLQINFKGQDSPDIYGVALDGYSGVAVDNISLRGSKGLEFTKINQANLQQMYDLLNVKLLIMQFGVNVVPHIKKNYDDYEHDFYKQLVLLKSILPHIQIIVVGVSDMSKKERGQFVTYPNVEKIRQAQKNACFKAGCVFWDSYEAMGGRNSMPAWVNHKPALGQKDYTHFSFEGAKVIAQMIYDAIMHDYEKFEKSTATNE